VVVEEAESLGGLLLGERLDAGTELLLRGHDTINGTGPTVTQPHSGVTGGGAPATCEASGG
jgi:hypothetical protein